MNLPHSKTVTPTATVSPSNPVCYRRGSHWLTREDLQAHLAAILRLENVGVLLGSGASIGDLGGKTMEGLWLDFQMQSPTSDAWLESQGFTSKGTVPNPEILADALEIAVIEWKRAANPALPQLLVVRADLQRAVIRAALLQQRWWEDASAVTIDAAELKHHRLLLQKTTSARQPGQPAPWVFTTNYDLAVEWAAETLNLKVINGFDGLHRRSFSPHNFDLGWRNVLARGEARFGTYHVYIAKLHGSLSWFEASDGSVLEAATGSRWRAFSQFLEASSSDVPGLVVLPSATKYHQTVGFVLGEMFRRLAEYLARPQTCLVISGYSFSDEHLNRLLVTALQNPTLQLVIYLPEARRIDDTLNMDRATAWARKVAALESPQVTFVGGGSDAFFSRLVEDLPDPAIYDEQALRIRKMMGELRSSSTRTRAE